MQDLSTIYIIAVVVIAFIAGYAIVSFVVRFFKRTSRKEETEERQEHQDGRSSYYPTLEKDERYYATTLGFKGPVTVDEIKRRYRVLISQYHPDKTSNLGPELKEVAEQKTRKINEAYEYFKKKYRIP